MAIARPLLRPRTWELRHLLSAQCIFYCKHLLGVSLKGQLRFPWSKSAVYLAFVFRKFDACSPKCVETNVVELKAVVTVVSFQCCQSNYLGQVMQTWSKMLHLILWKFWFWYLFKSKRCSVNFQSFHYFTTFPSILATPYIKIIQIALLPNRGHWKFLTSPVAPFQCSFAASGHTAPVSTWIKSMELFAWGPNIRILWPPGQRQIS